MGARRKRAQENFMFRGFWERVTNHLKNSEQLLIAFALDKEPYMHTLEEETTPFGLLARGIYAAKLKFLIHCIWSVRDGPFFLCKNCISFNPKFLQSYNLAHRSTYLSLSFLGSKYFGEMSSVSSNYMPLDGNL